jgi:hypothetical protein
MEGESLTIKTKMYIMAIGKIINFKAMAYISQEMEINIKDNSSKE